MEIIPCKSFLWIKQSESSAPVWDAVDVGTPAFASIRLEG